MAIELRDAAKVEFLGQLWAAKAQVHFNDMDRAVQFALTKGGWIAANADETEVTWFSPNWTVSEAMKALPAGRSFRVGPFSDFRKVERVIAGDYYKEMRHDR